jgi:hypothetical protein
MNPDFASKNPLAPANPRSTSPDLSKHSHAYSMEPTPLSECVLEVVAGLILQATSHESREG